MVLFRHWPLRWVWTVAFALLSVLIVVNSAIYFQPGSSARFLLEKGVVAYEPLWQAAFYGHVVSACICLLAGFPLFFPQLLQRSPRTHKVLGYVYFNAVLWCAAPTGLLLSPSAKGGVMGATGFVVTGVLWWWSTLDGLLAIRRGDIQGHLRGVVRSYSLALSAPIFRVFQVVFASVGLDPHVNYVSSLWCSLAASLLISESWIACRLPTSQPAATQLKGVSS